MAITSKEGTHKSDNESEASEHETSASENDEYVEDDTNSMQNAGWADSVAKILKSNKPKNRKVLVLSRAKKLGDIKPTKPVPAGFQIETAEGKVKEETVEVITEIAKPPRKKKKEYLNIRKKPNILEKARERTLTKIATKGVVQLFNAVRLQQKDITKKLDEAGPLDVRKEKVLKSIDKRGFLNVLMGEKSHVVDTSPKDQVKDGQKSSTWSVLQEDFMTGVKLKDWDKELEEEMEVE